MTLTKKIIIFMVLGAVTGIVLNLAELNPQGWVHNNIINGFFYVVGKLFINALKMMVVPLVFVSLFCGTTALKKPAMLGSLGGRTLAFYLLTTAIALVIAISLAALLQIGIGANLPSTTGTEYHAKQGKPLVDVILNIIPSNPIQAMAEANMLAVIVFAILLGLSANMAGDAGRRVTEFFNAFNEVIMKLVTLIMQTAPYAVFAILAKVFTELGVDAIKDLFGYFLTVLLVLFIHALVVYPTLLKLIGGLNPLTFLKKMKAAAVFAFSTSSSNASIPVTLRTVTERLGVRNSVASFTIPFGATINMDGTAIMQGVATIFIANAYGIDLTIGQLVTVVIMATLASIGTAGVPSAGMIMLQGVFLQVGLPVEGIAIILGIDRLLDMTRTVVNITGDASVSCIVAKSQGMFKQEVFDDPNAGMIKT